MIFRARLARTGWQTYPEGPELRLAEHVFARDSLASYVHAPVTIGHVAWIDAGNRATHAVGRILRVWREDSSPDDYVTGELEIYDPRTVELLRNGRLREVSMGYSVDHEIVDGSTIQTQIRINHAALLPPGGARCGSGCSVAA